MLSRDCEFKHPDELLRERIVFGTNDKVTQEKIIKSGSVELEETIQQFRTAEITSTQAKEVMQPTRDSTYASVDETKFHKTVAPPFSKQPSRPTQSTHGEVLCKWCGYHHIKDPVNCPARGKTCSLCGRRNHFAKVCKSRGELHIGKSQNSKLNEVKEVYTGRHNNTQANQQWEDYYCSLVFALKETDHIATICWKETGCLENVIDVTFKLDYGACVNILPLETFSLLKQRAPKTVILKKETRSLAAYNNSEIKVVGCTDINLTINGVCLRETFIVVDEKSVPILGLQTCEKMGLLHRNVISEVGDQSKDNIVTQYADVFSGTQAGMLCIEDTLPDRS
ncbi:uncharacterized protein LOC134546240 [Bacillus rossius redtenbacheri]|uniref:uncharacterized protein LOC134546240 n=1 Tax=Bacillus rossius redtenbacheri TaxID=93214 RepID=UPI002FDE7A4C